MTVQFADRFASSPRLAPVPCYPPTTSDVVIDLSHWQASVDFARAKAAGIVAVILKATQGTSWIDATFAERLAAARAAGLLAGAYHFMDDSPPQRQVDHFLSVAESCGVLAIDCEPNGIGSTSTITQTAEAAARLHMATGRAPLIYIGRYGPDGRGTGFPNGVLSRCPLWLPAYNSRPVCPPGWTAWTLWQHTDGNVGSDVVPVPGIGRCDRSRFAGTVVELASWWNSPHM